MYGRPIEIVGRTIWDCGYRKQAANDTRNFTSTEKIPPDIVISWSMYAGIFIGNEADIPAQKVSQRCL